MQGVFHADHREAGQEQGGHHQHDGGDDVDGAAAARAHDALRLRQHPQHADACGHVEHERDPFDGRAGHERRGREQHGPQRRGRCGLELAGDDAPRAVAGQSVAHREVDGGVVEGVGEVPDPGHDGDDHEGGDADLHRHGPAQEGAIVPVDSLVRRLARGLLDSGICCDRHPASPPQRSSSSGDVTWSRPGPAPRGSRVDPAPPAPGARRATGPDRRATRLPGSQRSTSAHHRHRADGRASTAANPVVSAVTRCRTTSTISSAPADSSASSTTTRARSPVSPAVTRTESGATRRASAPAAASKVARRCTSASSAEAGRCTTSEKSPDPVTLPMRASAPHATVTGDPLAGHHRGAPEGPSSRRTPRRVSRSGSGHPSTRTKPASHRVASPAVAASAAASPSARRSPTQPPTPGAPATAASRIHARTTSSGAGSSPCGRAGSPSPPCRWWSSAARPAAAAALEADQPGNPQPPSPPAR